MINVGTRSFEDVMILCIHNTPYSISKTPRHSGDPEPVEGDSRISNVQRDAGQASMTVCFEGASF